MPRRTLSQYFIYCVGRAFRDVHGTQFFRIELFVYMLTEQILQLVYGSRNFAHDFMDPEYFGGIVFLAALGILEFYFTDADMLNHAKCNCCTSYGTISGTHLIPYREYI